MYNKLATVEKHMLCITYIHTYILIIYIVTVNGPISPDHIYVASTFLPKKKHDRTVAFLTL